MAHDRRKAQCRWTLDTDGDSWDTQCGEKFQFTVDGPTENGMRFCCYCGQKLKPVQPKR